uniref:HTH OST-type domain-containing protein n=1 Tax=Anopheles maculatus TaxID=74869 RepID=A0A182TAV4_9DIPT
MDELKPIIRSLAISSAGGLTLQQLERDFKSLEGYSIPYERLGFKSLAALLQTLTDVVRLNGKDGQSTIHPVATEKNEHIRALVEKSKKSKKKPTVVREYLPQKPKSSSKPCINVPKYTTKLKEKPPSYRQGSRSSGAVSATVSSSSSSPSFGNYNESDYHFQQFLRWLYDVLKENVNPNEQNTAQAQNNQNCGQNRQQQRPPSVQSSGRNNKNSAGNKNAAGSNNGTRNNSNNNPAGLNNSYAGWYNYSDGWNNYSAGWNYNSSGWNSNYAVWNNNSAGWNNNSAGWNNISAGCNYNATAQHQGNMNNGNNGWNGNYPSHSNYGNNGAYYNGYGNYGMNYPTNYGYNNNSSNGFANNGQNNYMSNLWNSYGQYLPYYYS